MPASPRRHDLDWIRVGAFLLLILYHIGMFYVPWDWHVKSPRLVPAIEPAMMLTSPWRLILLFVVSGAASRFLFDRLGDDVPGAPGRFARRRLARLAPPLLFAVFVIVPPQSYYEVVEALRVMGAPAAVRAAWLDHFWLRYASGTGGWCDQDGCLWTPTWNHMWFVLYLLIYDLVLAGAALLNGAGLPALDRRVEHALAGWRLLVLPAAWLIVLRVALSPLFPATNDLVGDWYNHAISFSAVAFGFVTARSAQVRADLIRFRRLALTLGLLAWLLLVSRAQGWLGEAAQSSSFAPFARVLWGLDQWCFVVAAMGYAARYLTKGGPLLSYLTAGVFSFYIVHQTIIVVAAHHLARLRLPLSLEAALLLTATLLGCWLAYEVARRIGWIGVLLGTRPACGQTRTARRPAPLSP